MGVATTVKRTVASQTRGHDRHEDERAGKEAVGREGDKVQ